LDVDERRRMVSPASRGVGRASAPPVAHPWRFVTAIRVFIEIRASSAPGFLPFTSEGSTLDDAVPEARGPGGEAGMIRPRILIAESDVVLARFLAVFFSHWGYETETVADGVDALVSVGRSPPAAVVTDLDLPDLDGLQFAAALKANLATRAIPIIAINAGDESELRAALAAGCAACLGKPLDTSQLLALLRAVAPIGYAP
jgi:CheY-like chemotaxis protein